MSRAISLSRRAALACGIAATALMGTRGALGQNASAVPDLPDTGIIPFADRMRQLTGFDPLPRDLLNGLYDAIGTEGSAALLSRGAAPTPEQKRAMKALYHGILAPRTDDDSAQRIGYSNALKWAAVERSNNVPSYCGGLPGFWADPPDTEA